MSASPARLNAGRILLSRPQLLDVPVEAAQGAEDLLVVAVVRAQLDPVGPGNRQRDLQDVDRVQPEALLVERSLGIDVGRARLEVERGDDQLRQLELLRTGRFALCLEIRYGSLHCFAPPWLPGSLYQVSCGASLMHRPLPACYVKP